MKTNIIRKIQILGLMFCLVMGFIRCESNYELELPLAVNDTILTIKASEGESRVLVYSTGDWKATIDQSWATITEGDGNGNSGFMLHWTANEGIYRQATITLTSGSLQKQIRIQQRGSVSMSSFQFSPSELEASADGGQLSYTCDFFIPKSQFELMTIDIKYVDENHNVIESDDWLSVDLETSTEGLKFNFTVVANTTGNERIACVKVSFMELVVTENINGDEVYRPEVMTADVYIHQIAE